MIKNIASIHLPLIWGWFTGAPSPGRPPPACPGKHQGVPRPAERYNLSSVSWGCPRASSRWDMPRTPHPGGILIRCPNHLNWLLSMWRSSSFTLSLSRMAELLTLSLSEMPAIVRRKPISATCIRNLVLLVNIHSL